MASRITSYNVCYTKLLRYVWMSDGQRPSDPITKSPAEHVYSVVGDTIQRSNDKCNIVRKIS